MLHSILHEVSEMRTLRDHDASPGPIVQPFEDVFRRLDVGLEPAQIRRRTLCTSHMDDARIQASPSARSAALIARRMNIGN
jgi:hypothetical protein